MAVSISTAARNAAADAVAALVDGGSAAGKLRVYSGAKPATPGTSASGTLLLEFDLSDPAFAAASSGAAALDLTPAVTADGEATGTAGYFRFVDSDEAAGTGLGVVDGTVTATSGGGDLELSTVSITAGLTVTISSFTLTMPAAA